MSFRIGVCLSLLALASAQAAPLRLDTEGGDAWTFEKTIEGRIAPAGACDAVLLRSPAGKVAAWSDGRRFAAEVPLDAGDNRVEAICQTAGTEKVSDRQRWEERLPDAPKAWARVRAGADRVWLDAGRSARAPGRPAPLTRVEWLPAEGNPAPLALPATGDRIELPAPAVDGEYLVRLRVTDALGRIDEAHAMFRVEAGKPVEIDLETEHPAWVDTAVLYGVVPYFFGRGDFRSVTARLDEIAALGATVIWLSPVMAPAEGDFGYAVVDPFRLRADFGPEADFRALVAAAHARGLKVILDFVPNHVSDQHPYFQDAERRGQASPYYDWFERDAEGEATGYFDWEDLKNLDYDNPEVQNYIIAAALHWLREYGVDGFRVDVGWGVRERAPEFWERWRAELKRVDPDIFLIAEASARDAYYVANGFDAAYDWSGSPGEWAWLGAFTEGGAVDLGRLRAALTNNGTGYPADTLTLRFLNNNDTGARFITRHGLGLTRVAAALSFTLPGVPLIYMGDEIGAEFQPYDEGPPLAWRDPHGLTAYYTRLAKLRKSVPALTGREFRLLDVSHEDRVLAFLRPGMTPSDSVLVLLNFGAEPVDARLTAVPALTGMLGAGNARDLMSGETLRLDPRAPKVRLPAYGARVIAAAH